VSDDGLLTSKIRDVVGLYLAPPDGAVVFAVDEKPQIQALERTAPVLPMLPGVLERRSHDHFRHGTVDLLAVLNTATGKVIGKLSAQHRVVDFRDFPGDIDRQTEPGLAVYVICDNLCSNALTITCRGPGTPSPSSRRIGAGPIGRGAGQRARRMTGDPEGGPCPGVRLADPCPAPDRRVWQVRPAVGSALPNSLHAVYTATSQCLRGATFRLPQYLVAVLFPGLNAPIPVLASEKPRR